jgi:hypothetical protein
MNLSYFLNILWICICWIRYVHFWTWSNQQSQLRNLVKKKRIVKVKTLDKQKGEKDFTWKLLLKENEFSDSVSKSLWYKV